MAKVAKSLLFVDAEKFFDSAEKFFDSPSLFLYFIFLISVSFRECCIKCPFLCIVCFFFSFSLFAFDISKHIGHVVVEAHS